MKFRILNNILFKVQFDTNFIYKSKYDLNTFKCTNEIYYSNVTNI